ncbi:MAG: lycopene cyclase family protein [Woeseia sp.]
MADLSSRFDVAIIGGGLSGLTLALQLNQSSPELAIIVLERSRLPPPAAAHKVGEATVEIGAHYLAHTLGLKPFLDRSQLRKFGLRMFFGSGYHDDLARADELGSSRFLPATSYQLDRGTLEKKLIELLTERGVDVQGDSRVRRASVSANSGAHELVVVQDGNERRIQSHWLIDAASRARLLKRALKLDRQPSHRMCSSWLRVDKVIDVDEWSECPDWKSLCHGGPRRLSTNHLMGPGYWAWLIPLAGDRTSIGLVADPALHPQSTYDTLDKLEFWLARHQPILAEAVAGARNTVMDFRTLKNLSQDSGRVWGARWALTGEAGVFADPFYSPGSDFIGISNTFISDLIITHRSDGEHALYAEAYERMYKSFFSSTMSLYEGQYPGFGDTRLMVLKLTWDYAYYWSVLAWLFFREVMTDISFLRSLQPALIRTSLLNQSLQKEFRKRAAEQHQDRGCGRFFDQSAIPVLAGLNAALLDNSSNLRAEFSGNCERLEALAPLLLSLLDGHSPANRGSCSLLGDLADRF